jgi:hypothetical protein
MSKSARYEWHDQQAAMNARFKGFLKNPGMEQMEAVLADMRAYADSAKQGRIEIPMAWTTYD